MRRNSDLFDLIRSMNKNEKRYFRLYASMQSGSKNYLKLFDAVEKMSIYDENRLREKNKKENFITNIAYTKNYLYEQIIKSLALYNNERSVDGRIHQMISECRILFSKALFRQYFRAISRAKEYSLKHERFGYYLQILDMEKVIIKKEELQTEKFISIYNEAVMAVEKIKNMLDYSTLASRVIIHYRKYGTARGEKQDLELQEILDNPLARDINMAKSERARESFYRLYELIYNTRAEYDKTLEAVEMRRKTAALSPEPFKDYILDFNSDIIFSIIRTCLDLNRLSDVEIYLKEYQETLTKTRADKIDFEIFSTYVKFQLCIKKGDLKKASRLIPVLNGLLKLYENKILLDTELGILYNIIKCRIMEKNYNAALRSVNELMDHPFLHKRADYESYTRILNLIIHFELENYSLLKYLIISTYRYLYKREKKFRLETLILEFIRKIPEVKDEEGLRFTFSELKTRLEKLKKDEYEKNAFEYFDFLEWIKSKIAYKTEFL